MWYSKWRDDLVRVVVSLYHSKEVENFSQRSIVRRKVVTGVKR